MDHLILARSLEFLRGLYRLQSTADLSDQIVEQIPLGLRS